MIVVLVAVAAATAAGILARRRSPARARRASELGLRVVLFVVLPVVVFPNVARLHVDAALGGGLLLGYLALALAGAAAAVLGRRVLGLSPAGTGALVLAAILANTGFLGLPLCVALLGHEELGRAAAWDGLVSAPTLLLAGFGIGAALGDRAGAGPRARARAFLARNPPLLAVALALVVPDALAPPWLLDASRVLVVLLLPVGFFAVGVALRVPLPLTPAIGAAVALRCLLAPGLLLLLALPVLHLPAAFALQAAMPVGVNSLVVSEAFGLDAELLAGAVAWSTLVVVVGAGVAAVGVG